MSNLYTGFDETNGTASWNPLWQSFQNKKPNIVRLKANEDRELVEIREEGEDVAHAMADFFYSFGKAALWTKQNVIIHTNIRDCVEELAREDIRYHCYMRVSYDK